jgi:hypothetical protein
MTFWCRLELEIGIGGNEMTVDDMIEIRRSCCFCKEISIASDLSRRSKEIVQMSVGVDID